MRPIFERPQDYILVSARGAARRLKVHPATILRTVTRMGFSGYSEFLKYLRDLALLHTTPLDLMRNTQNRELGLPAYLWDSLDHDLKNIDALRHTIDFSQLHSVVKRLYSAPRILILGGDLASNLSNFLHYSLALIGLPAFSATTSGLVVQMTQNLNNRDVVIAISFGRGLRQTIEGLKRARDNGAYGVGITDTSLSPIARYAHTVFLTSIDGLSYGGSYVAPMALLNLFSLVCANYRRARTVARLKVAEQEQREGYRWYSEE